MLRISAALVALLAVPVTAQPLASTKIEQIDQLVTRTLADTGVPSAEIAIVRNGGLVLTKAYGKANEGLQATPTCPIKSRQIPSSSPRWPCFCSETKGG